MSSSLAIRPFFSLPWLEKSRATHATAASELDHIFIIAGPSGSGKSTFMREFVENRLPRDISDYLPEGGKTWHRTSGNSLSRKGLAGVRRGEEASPGLVLHYDIMRPFARGFRQYHIDPAMQALTQTRAALTFLTILPSRELLVDQFIKRAANDQYEEWWDRTRPLRLFKRRLRAALFDWSGRRRKFLKAEQLRLLRIYASDHGLERWGERWTNFLEGTQRERDDVTLLFITSEPQHSEYPRFRLLRRITSDGVEVRA
jgi:hypothetical protein